MTQNQKFADLLLRNEDWLLSRVLCHAKANKNSDFFQLINHSWRTTISSFTQLLGHSLDCNLENQDISFCNNSFNSTQLLEFVTNEVYQCHQKSIDSYIYLTYLKLFRSIYMELINSAYLEDDEKLQFSRKLELCFNCIEIGFIKKYNLTKKEIEQENILSNLNNKKMLESLAFPAFTVDIFNQVAEYNTPMFKIFTYLFEKDTSHLQQFSSHTGFKELILKIDEFRISHHQEGQIKLLLQTAAEKSWHLTVFKKLKDTEEILVTFIDINNWQTKINGLIEERDKAIESNKLKTSYLANMSHEIRTPMNAIVGFAELISMSDLGNDDRKEYLSLIRKSSNDLLNIIEDVIDIAKIESSQLKIIPKNTSLSELFADIHCIYNNVLVKHDKPNVTLNLSIPETENDLVIRTDPKRLKQVISNLVGNAIKFTEEGQIELGYKLAENKIVYFFVKDSGIGIPYDRQKHIFDRFVQVEETYAKNVSGTGLGLTISKNIITLMGGNIWVSSTPGKGSNFYFYLPNIPAKHETKKGLTQVNNSNYFLQNKNILIAEDEDANFLYLKEIFRPSGVNIYRAKTGTQAISKAENQDLDLILMDIKMPEVNGIEAARYIHHIKPDLPIIALTAFAMDDDKANCLNSGCKEYLSKPVKKEILFNAINKHLGRVTKRGADKVGIK